MVVMLKVDILMACMPVLLGGGAQPAQLAECLGSLQSSYTPTCLAPPSCQGMELLTGFLRKLVAERARADYDALVDSFASGLWVPAVEKDSTHSVEGVLETCMPTATCWQRLLPCANLPTLQRSTAGAAPTMWAPSQTCSRSAAGWHAGHMLAGWLACLP